MKHSYLTLTVLVFLASPIVSLAENAGLSIAVPYLPQLKAIPDYREPISRLVFSNLATGLTAIQNEEQTLEAASSLSSAEGGKIWSLRLRDDAAFANGRPLKLDDALLTLEQIAESEANHLFDIESVKTKGGDLPYPALGSVPGEIEISLRRPNAKFDRLLSLIPIIDSDLIRATSRHLGTGTLLSYLGPYVIREQRPERAVILEGVRFFFIPGRPSAAALSIVKYSDAKSALSALRVGSVDVIALPTEAQLEAAAKDQTLAVVESPFVPMARLSGDWRPKENYWTNSKDPRDRLSTEKIVIRKTLQLDQRAKDTFDLSGAYYNSLN